MSSSLAKWRSLPCGDDTYMNHIRRSSLFVMAMLLIAAGSSAQTPAKDPSTRLREVLPADVAQRVLARIADARARQLPAEALENRALKFAAKGVDPKSIERSVNEQADRMALAKAALANGRASTPAVAFIVPRAHKTAALQRVLERLRQRASDSDLEAMPGELPAQAQAGQANRPTSTGRDFGQSHRPTSTGRPASAGPPAGIPGNAGKKSNPGQSHRPPPKN